MLTRTERVVAISEPKTRSATRIAPVDGLRGLAILGVIYQHNYAAAIAGTITAGGWASHAYIISDAWMGVSLFFVLSGFVLSLPFFEGRRRMDNRADYVAFVVHRGRRLFPLMLIASAVGFAASVTAGAPALRSFLLAVTTLNMFTSSEFFSTVFPVGWSLNVEVWASFALPFVIVGALRYGWARTLAAVLAVALVVRLIGTHFHFINFHVRPLKDSVPARLDDFAVGAFVAALHARGALKALPGWAFPVGFATMIAAMLLSDVCLYGLAPEWTLAFVNNLAHTGFGIMLAVVVARPSRLSGVLSSWPLALAGAMCFSLYVWHGPFRAEAFLNHPFGLRNNLAYWPPLLITALVSYRYVEFPGATWRQVLRVSPR
jgi:peptidoglycan/LPS O-acetylase OafA/YrhL